MKMPPAIAIEIDKVDEEMGFSNYAIASLAIYRPSIFAKLI
ncbi:hypothetical protein [Roseofilum casamattae]|uniref:Uncharacterized protein n=1 Tax=Roseofilum casamattae BLCC-M143 TaxID=3022442 RepID=A0ABT7C354_9CYAN|nr:hypothetical protein [Roseofilum casamattae]MDJ1185895.1 hypothetical protein [Roseofilum casamattae BLCC-M143]